MNAYSKMSSKLQSLVFIHLFFIAWVNCMINTAVEEPSTAFLWYPHHRFDEAPPSSNNQLVNKFTTRSLTLNQFSNIFSKHALDAKIIVFVDSFDQNLKTDLKKSISDSSSKYEILSSIYKDKNNKSAMESILEHPLLKSAKLLSLHEIINTLENNEMLGTYRTHISNKNDLKALDKLANIGKGQVLMIAIDESDALLPNLKSQYSRRLSSSTTLAQGFSIWYDSDYLYITPDIFTAIMTGLFLTAAAFIGFTCLGAIQGPSSFVDRNPTVGKEG